jgi:hypothetical protein
MTLQLEQQRRSAMFLSEAWANRLFDYANVALVLSLVTGVAATALVVWTGGVKEQYLNVELTATKERAATLENDAAQAKLELQKLKDETGPRKLDREIFQKTLEGQPSAPVEILYMRDDADSLEFAQEIENDLVHAHWTVISRLPIPTPTGANADPTIPIAMTVGGQPSGVTVVAHSVSEEESQATWNAVIGKDWIKTPWTVLSVAFGRSMGKMSGAGTASCPEGRLRVIVAPRP